MKKLFIVFNIFVMSIFLFSCDKKDTEVVFDTNKLNIEEGLYLRDDKKTNDDLNLRYIVKDNYKLSVQPKYGINSIEGVDTTGLDDLCVSASGQYDEEQFKEIAKNIKNLANGKEVYIIDLRSESHGFFNGRPGSWYKFHNTANESKKYEEIIVDEKDKLKNARGKNIIMYTIESDEFTGESEYFEVQDVKTEQELVESEGFNYLRYTCVDHRWPSDNKVKAFMDFFENKNLDNVWLHFHCSGGVGRTGVFMAIYDMMKNKNVSLENIVKRQSILGSKNLLEGGKEGSWKKDYADEIKEKIKYFYDYIHGGEVNKEENEKNYESINKIRSENLSKQLVNLEHEEKDAASTVYFTKDISADGMVKIYDVLNSAIKDSEKLGAKVAVKLSTGEAGNTHYLKPELIGDLVKKVNGTIVECNTAYGGKRSSTKEHMKVAEDHGFTKIANVDIMDDKGEFSIPVNEKAEILEKDIVGINLKNYDSILCLSHFKGHQMGGFDGAIKNMSIGVASPNGKAYIHSAGKTEDVSNMWSNTKDQVGFEKAMAEAADSVRNYVNKKVIYINVMNNISIDCDCVSNPALPDMHDVGILASTDPVALDQACVDIVYNTDRKESQSLINRIEKQQGHIQIDHSEKIGAGNKKYQFEVID